MQASAPAVKAFAGAGGAPDMAHARIGSLWIGVGLGRQVLVRGAPGVDPHLLGERIPFLCRLVERSLGVLAGERRGELQLGAEKGEQLAPLDRTSIPAWSG